MMNNIPLALDFAKPPSATRLGVSVLILGIAFFCFSLWEWHTSHTEMRLLQQQVAVLQTQQTTLPGRVAILQPNKKNKA